MLKTIFNEKIKKLLSAGSVVLDACAAPGMKTSQLAGTGTVLIYAVKSRGVDVDPHVYADPDPGGKIFKINRKNTVRFI